MIVVPREGWDALVGGLLTRTTDPEPLVLRLFRNPPTKKYAARTADLAEATFRGYIPTTLESTGWRLRARSVAHREHTFRCTQAPAREEPVYGYAVIGDRTERLYWYERFEDGPYRVARADDEIVVTPALALQALRRPKER